LNRPLTSGRALKREVRDLLKSQDLEEAAKVLCRIPGRRVVNPLFSLLHSSDQALKWAAVEAMGAVVTKMAHEKMEDGRIIMRRLMWNLNDESGGIGWGSPEAMGEILARHGGLAEEYAHVLMSYTKEDGNYLEHKMLQRGLLWGIGRLAEVRPDLVKKAVPELRSYLESEDATVRGLAASLMGVFEVKESCPKLRQLADDESPAQVYQNREMVDCCVKDLAKKALAMVKC